MSIEHYENFPVASWLCPRRFRQPIAAIYGFARTADDIADEGDDPPPLRRARLQAYRADLLACAAAEQRSVQWPGVFTSLGHAIREFSLPLSLLLNLLDAFEQDTANPLHPDRASLLDYCSRSANPVGRLLLHLYGVDDANALRESDQICTALQLINFWQDPSVDLPRHRCYFPLDDLARHGLQVQALLGSPGHRTSTAEATRAMLRDLVDWARMTLLDGQGLVHRIPGRAGWELRGVVQGGLRILEKIETMNYDTLRKRPQLHAWDVPLLAWRACWMRSA